MSSLIAFTLVGEMEAPIRDSPWGFYFGCFRDRYGIEWIIEFDSNNIG